MDHIGQLRPDPRNARRHTSRNVGMIESALREVGAARSIVVDEDGVILAGNATVEAAAAAGIERVITVDADGETIVAVRRSGLTPEQKTKLALYDNRAAELADWDAGVLASVADEVDLSGLFFDDELTAILGGLGDVPVIPEPSDPPSPSLKSECFVEIACTAADLDAFRPTLTAWSERDGVTVNIS